MSAGGFFAGYAEYRSAAFALALVAMLPLFSALKCQSRRSLVLKLLPFLAAYNFTKTAFLLNFSQHIELQSRSAAALLSIAAAVGVSLIPLCCQLVCLPFFCRVRSGAVADAATLSLLFCASEWLCENLGPLSFPWLGVWAQAARSPEFLMSANLLGCRFTSFILLTLCGMLYLAAEALAAKNLTKVLKPTAVFATVLTLTLLYGRQEIYSLKAQAAESPSLAVMSVQLDCEGREKSGVSARIAAERYSELIGAALAEGERAEIVFLPETAVHTTYGKDDSFAPLENLAREQGISIATGCFFREDGRKFNCIAAISPSGETKCVYKKSHLVPFGEYMPFSGIFGKRTLFAAGDINRPAEIDGRLICCGICIESTYSELFRQGVRSGGELLYIPTNDSWFGDSHAREAHYLHSKMRAIENSRFAVRSGNCGISAVISPWGEELAADLSRECGCITAEVRTLRQKSLYTTVGDSFMLAPLSVILSAAIKSAKLKFTARRSA